MPPHEYRLIVKGELGPRYASAFAGMTTTAHDGITEIAGPINDPSHLQGVLDRIASLGLTLHTVTPIHTDDDQPTATPTTKRRPATPGPGVPRRPGLP
jgi:hypothetical protein